MIKLEFVLKTISRWLGYISCIGTFFIMFFMTADVILRWVLNKPILGSMEIVEVTMSVIIFASFAYAQTEKGHVSVTMLLRIFPEKVKMLVWALGTLLSCGTAAFASYATFRQVIYTAEKGYATGILGIPLTPFYLIGGITLAIFAIVLLADTILAITALWDKDVSSKIQSEW